MLNLNEQLKNGGVLSQQVFCHRILMHGKEIMKYVHTRIDHVFSNGRLPRQMPSVYALVN